MLDLIEKFSDKVIKWILILSFIFIPIIYISQHSYNNISNFFYPKNIDPIEFYKEHSSKNLLEVIYDQNKFQILNPKKNYIKYLKHEQNFLFCFSEKRIKNKDRYMSCLDSVKFLNLDFKKATSIIKYDAINDLNFK